MINNYLLKIKNHPELFILLLVFTIIAMLVIPLPTFLVDFLIGLNIVLSTLVFLSSFYIDRILSFSSFPAVLLITTLFRLSLSISTSRLILNDADAGEIIATFGLFVIGDNLVVGFVIFAIVTIVQFLVITKGAERVAEVAARFSLDGMPGKQMSIDADVRAGSLSSDEATKRRSVLEKESQLYGSFDGAMKFIKGDAIAGIIVIFINFIGGISVGISQHNMDMDTALKTYTMLTIGDGLVAQIPSLLIAISAGFIVTRVSGEGSNMGVVMVDQLLTNRFVLIIAALLAILIGSLPGFPLFIFILLAMIPGGLALFKWHQAKQEIDKNKNKELHSEHHDISEDVNVEKTPTETTLGLIKNLDQMTPVTVPLILRVSGSVADILSRVEAQERYRSQFFLDYGIHLPEIIIKGSSRHESDKIALLINEIQAEEYVIPFDRLAIINGSDEITYMGFDTLNINNVLWINQDKQASVTELGFHLRTPVDELYYCLATTLVRNVNEIFGVQETKAHLDKLEKDYPELIKEATRNATVQRIAEVLQRLINEKISVRNTKLITETLAIWAPREKDVIALVEHIRGALSRYISHKFPVNGTLSVVLLSGELEETIRRGIRTTGGGAFLNLEPAESERIMSEFSVALDSIYMSQKDYVILTAIDIRRFVKRFLENKFRNLEVLSYGEITDSVNVEVIKTV